MIDCTWVFSGRDPIRQIRAWQETSIVDFKPQHILLHQYLQRRILYPLSYFAEENKAQIAIDILGTDSVIQGAVVCPVHHLLLGLRQGSRVVRCQSRIVQQKVFNCCLLFAVVSILGNVLGDKVIDIQKSFVSELHDAPQSASHLAQWGNIKDRVVVDRRCAEGWRVECESTIIVGVDEMSFVGNPNSCAGKPPISDCILYDGIDRSPVESAGTSEQCGN